MTITRDGADYDDDDDDDDGDDDGDALHRASRAWSAEGDIDGDGTDELDDTDNAEGKDDDHGNESQSGHGITRAMTVTRDDEDYDDDRMGAGRRG